MSPPESSAAGADPASAERRKIVYIAGLPHSGSTLLDLLLSGHPQICGVGEVARLIDPKVRAQLLASGKERLCSCGEAVTPEPRCPVWKELLPRWDARPSGDLALSYAELLTAVDAQKGPGTWVSDSSKSLRRLKQLHLALQSPALEGCELRVLHLVRDVRSLAASWKRRHKDGLRQQWRRFGEWHRAHRRFDRYLRETGIKHLQIGYEELSLFPETLLPQICSFLRLPYHAEMSDLAASRGHIGIGNPMRMDTVRRFRMTYDHRWFREDAINAIYLMRPRIRSANREWVYSNIARPPRGGDLSPGSGASG